MSTRIPFRAFLAIVPFVGLPLAGCGDDKGSPPDDALVKSAQEQAAKGATFPIQEASKKTSK